MSNETVTNYCTTFPRDIFPDFDLYMSRPRTKPVKTTPSEDILLERGYVLRRQLRKAEIEEIEGAVPPIIHPLISKAEIRLDFLKPETGVNLCIVVEDRSAISTRKALEELKQSIPGLEIAPPQTMLRSGLKRYDLTLE